MGRKKKISPLEGHEDWIKNHTRIEIMNKFSVDYNHVNNFCVRKGIKPVNLRRRFIFVPDDGFIRFSSTHTITATAKEYNISYGLALSVIKRNNIAFVKCKKPKEYVFSANASPIKRTGEAQDMIRELSKTFTDASIARVFGYSRERIRQIRNEEK